MAMVYCPRCKTETEADLYEAGGFSACTRCGMLLEDNTFSTDPTFAKGADGESEMVGNFVSETGVVRGVARVYGRGLRMGSRGDSHEKTLLRARDNIAELVDRMGVRPRDDTIAQAHRIYKIALEGNFTRGRKAEQVSAVCIYIVCRQDDKPFMLIDFADQTGVDVYRLGAVFLELIKRLRLEHHPAISRPMDPSLYIHRFADRLRLGRGMHAVAATALRLVSSMKRDWIQTGRRPAGVCGAALYLAARMHGHKVTKREILALLHVGETTVDKRLGEFAATEAGSLTPEEFIEHSQMEEAEARKLLEAPPKPIPLPESGGCEHIQAGEAQFSIGLCRACYNAYIALSGGHQLRARDPVAFSAARNIAGLLEAPGPDRDAEGVENDREDRVEMDRAIGEMVQALPGRSGNEDSNGESPAATASPRSGPADGRGAGAGAELPERGEPRSGSQSPAPSRSNALAKLSATARLLVEQRAAAEAEAARRRARRIEEVRASVLLWQRRAAVEGQGGDAGNGGDGEAGGRDGGSDSDDGLADVPVEAVMHMLHTEEEAEVKGELWIELNHEWMEQEARKKADGAGREAGVARKGRGRPRAKAAAAEQPEPEQTPEAAAMRALESGRLSSKVNYDALSELFGSMTPVEGQTADQGAAAGVDGGALASGAASSMDKGAEVAGVAHRPSLEERPRKQSRLSRVTLADDLLPSGADARNDATGAAPAAPEASRAPAEESRRFRVDALDTGIGVLGTGTSAGRQRSTLFRPSKARR